MLNLILPVLLFLVGGVFALYRPYYAYIAALVITPWFEVATLQLGLPNQFIVEYFWLGVLLSSLYKKQFNRHIPAHPMLLPCLAAAVFTIVKYIPQLIELASISDQGLSLRKLLIAIWQGIFVWDIVNNPFHDLSVIVGYLLFFGIIVLGTIHLNKNPQRLAHMVFALLLASIPVHAIGFLQAWTELLSKYGTLYIGATFQNENLYSYYSGIMVILAFYVVFRFNERRPHLILGILTGVLGIIGLVLGRGRSAWVALVVALVFSSFLASLHKYFIKKDLKKSFSLKKVALVFSLSLLFVFFAALLFKEMIEYKDLKIFNVVSLDELLEKTKRKHIFLAAWESIQQHPLFGLGQGYFFNKSQTKFEIHNIWLDWSVGFGMWINVVVLLSLIPSLFCFVKKYCDPKSSAAYLFISSSILSYIAICTMPDHYFSYRTLLIISGVVLLFIFYDLPSISKRSIIIWGLMLPAVMGLLTFMSPHTRFNVDQVWAEEQNTESDSGNFQWIALARWLELKPNQCLSTELSSVFPSGSTLNFGVLHTAQRLSRFANLSDYKRLLRELGEGNKITLSHNKWKKFCWCFPNEAQSEIKLFLLIADKGEYLYLSKNEFGRDRRFISFGMSSPIYFTPSEYYKYCDQVTNL